MSKGTCDLFTVRPVVITPQLIHFLASALVVARTPNWRRSISPAKAVAAAAGMAHERRDDRPFHRWNRESLMNGL